ncbi:MAG: hypothetical protein J6M18_05060 [Actinomycetaceae bacterium]|nr:hypothetical protein [Actinomycetaceae bacterium]
MHAQEHRALEKDMLALLSSLTKNDVDVLDTFFARVNAVYENLKTSA